jgi:protein SCO1/2
MRLHANPGTALLLALVITAAPVQAAPPPLPAAAPLEIGATLPLGLPFVDEAGRAVRLGDYFDGRRPVVVVPGYYRCPNLCGLTMHGVLEALAATGLTAADVRVLRFGIDPDETATDAREGTVRDLAYAAELQPSAAPDLHALVGAPAAVRTLAAGLGVRYAAGDRTDADAPRWVHAVGFVVATPQGRIARAFDGVRFDAHDVRAAVVEAADGRLGTPVERLLLLCGALDPLHGRHAVAVMATVRALALVMVLLLGGWIRRHRRAPADGAAP